METSTFMVSATTLKDKIKSKYGFLKADCKLLSNYRNTIYKVSYYSAKYIFKIYDQNNRPLEEIEGEVELLKTLRKRGASISFPVNDEDGNYIQQFETEGEISYGVLFTFAEGEVCLKMTDEQLIMLGRELAIFHNITSTIQLQHQFKEYTLKNLMIDPVKILQPAFRNNEADYKYLEELNFIVIKRLAQLNLSRFDFGYVHGDLTPGNIHFQGNTRLTFIDFDLAGNGFLIQDIVGIYLHFFNLIRSGEATTEEASRSYTVFFESYLEIRALTDNEIDALPYMAAALLIYGIYFASQHMDKTRFSQYLEDNLQRLKDWTNSPMFQ
jgi:Ser/Thr protein kinase RdoA (MazF antagonist)